MRERRELALIARRCETHRDIVCTRPSLCSSLPAWHRYSEVRKNKNGETILSLDQVAAMTAKEGGPRPLLPDEMQTEVRELIEECWDDNP